MQFGAALRLLRVDAGISLRTLSQQIGVSSAYLSRVENGHDPAPTPDRLVAIAEALGIPAAVLLDLARQTGPVVSGYLERVPAASALFLEIAHRKLTAGQIARVKALVDAEFPHAEQGGAIRVSELITPSRIVLGLVCSDFEDIVQVATARLPSVPHCSKREIAERIMLRERESPTSLGGGMLAPHAVVHGAKPAGVVVTLSKPLNVQAPDDKPARAAVVLITDKSGERQLHLLAAIARLTNYGITDALCSATTAAQALGVMRRMESLW